MATMQLPDALGAQGDDALMSRIAARDALAFRLLIERHADRPHRIAWRMLGDATEAEDVAQEAMLRFWQNAASWRGGGPGLLPAMRSRSNNRHSGAGVWSPAASGCSNGANGAGGCLRNAICSAIRPIRRSNEHLPQNKRPAACATGRCRGLG